MAAHLDDPQNHVPEVSSGDAWGDFPSGTAGCYGAPVELPPRRATHDAPTSRDRTAGLPEAGFRIDPKPASRSSDDPPASIEVQEINGEVVRLDAIIPSPARIPRQNTFQPLPQSPDESPAQRGESREWGRASKHSLPWIIGSGVGIAGIVVFSLVMLPSINDSNAARPRPGQIELVLDPDEYAEELESLGDWLARRSEAMQLFGRFATTRVSDDLLPLIRDSNLIETVVTSYPPSTGVPSDWSPLEGTTWSALETEGRTFGVLEGTFPDFSEFRAYMVASGDHLVIDWKATTGYGSVTFDDLKVGRGLPDEIRAQISPTGFYTHVFPEADFQSYQLTSPDNRQSVWCYTRRGTPADVEIAKLFFEGEILKPEKPASRVTVSLVRGPEGSLPNQWIIEELLHPEWITP